MDVSAVIRTIFLSFQLDMAEGDVISLLKKFKALQEERAYTYNLFHE